MKEELTKSLTDLIDETLLELEELKKSRFSAEEIELKGPGETMAGKPTNGKLDAEKADKKDEDEDMEETEDAEKSEGVNGKAEKSEGVNGKAEKSEKMDTTCKAEKDEDKEEEDKKDEPHKDDPEHEEKEKKMAKKLLDMHKDEEGKMKKSEVEMESLMKSYIDERVLPLEAKLSTILDLVNKIADAPVAAKGVSYKGVTPLLKASEGIETLSKSEIANKLFELKKSGTRVDSTDIARAEMGHDLEKICSKYQIS